MYLSHRYLPYLTVIANIICLVLLSSVSPFRLSHQDTCSLLVRCTPPSDARCKTRLPTVSPHNPAQRPMVGCGTPLRTLSCVPGTCVQSDSDSQGVSMVLSTGGWTLVWDPLCPAPVPHPLCPQNSWTQLSQAGAGVFARFYSAFALCLR